MARSGGEGTEGKRVPGGCFAEGESEAEVASLTSAERGSGLCADQAGRAEGQRRTCAQWPLRRRRK